MDAMTGGSFSLARAVRLALAPEWCVLAALAAVDAVWAGMIGFRITWGWEALQPLLIVGLTFMVVRGLGLERAALFVEYFLLSLAGSFALIVFSYLCLASAGPLADETFLALDRAMGLDWLATRQWIESHPPLMDAMRLVYRSLVLQGLVITAILGIWGSVGQMRELWRLTTLACILCCLTAMALPALGPFKQFGFEAEAVFLPDLERLVAGRDLVFDPSGFAGIITFPSYHTVLALACPYALRHWPLLFWPFLVLNGLMLFTIPYAGGHYVVDMIGGATIFLVALAALKLSRPRQAKRQMAPAPA